MQEQKDKNDISGRSIPDQDPNVRIAKAQQGAITERSMQFVMSKCDDCSLHLTCLKGRNRFDGIGPEDADIMIVFASPPHIDNTYSPTQFKFFKAELAKICPTKKIRFTWALRCATPKVNLHLQADQFKTPAQIEQFKECKHYLEDEIMALRPKVVILCGPGPLFSALGKRDIHFQKYPGAMLKKDGISYMVTYDPAYVGDSRKYMNEIHAHLQKLPTLLLGDVFEYGVKYRTVETIEELERLTEYALKAKRMAFDFEVDTNIKSKVSGFGGNDALLGLGISFKPATGFYIPLDHPDSKFKDNPYVKDLVKQILMSDSEKCAHNALFDCYCGFYFLGGILVNNVTFDTMLAHHLIDPTSGTQSLKYLAMMTTQFGGYEDELQGILNSYPLDQRTYAKIPQDKLGPYCCIDVDVTFRLWNAFQAKINSDTQLEKLFRSIVMPSYELMFDLRTRAWNVDTDKIKVLETFYKAKEADLQSRLSSHPIRIASKYTDGTIDITNPKLQEFNPNSPAHLREIIYTQCKEKVKNWTKAPIQSQRKPSTDQSALKEIVYRNPSSNLSDFLQKVIQLKLTTKTLSTYIVGMRKHVTKGGYIFSEYLQTGTATARLSSRKPNMQNISSDLTVTSDDMKVKSMFPCPDKHRFVIVDYSQIELRNLANCTGDNTLVQTFLDGKNNHMVTAANVFGIEYDEVIKGSAEYRVGKTTNFAAVYGAGPGMLAEQIRDKAELTDVEINAACQKIGLSNVYIGVDIKTLNHLKFDQNLGWIFKGFQGTTLDREDVLVMLSAQILSELKRTWPGVTEWQNKVKKHVVMHGSVRSPFGRIRHLPLGHNPTNYERKHVYNMAINTPIQSVSSDCLLLAMVAINRYFKEGNFKSRIQGTVHDSVIFYIHEDEFKKVMPKIKFFMEEIPKAYQPEFFIVPLVVEFEVGRHWGDVKPYDLKQLEKI